MEYVMDLRERDTEPDVDRVAEVLGALGHPVRLRIVAALTRDDRCVGNLVDCLNLPQPLISRHLARLRQAGVVTVRRQGRQRIYDVKDDLAARIIALVYDKET